MATKHEIKIALTFAEHLCGVEVGTTVDKVARDIYDDPTATDEAQTLAMAWEKAVFALRILAEAVGTTQAIVDLKTQVDGCKCPQLNEGIHDTSCPLMEFPNSTDGMGQVCRERMVDKVEAGLVRGRRSGRFTANNAFTYHALPMQMARHFFSELVSKINQTPVSPLVATDKSGN